MGEPKVGVGKHWDFSIEFDENWKDGLEVSLDLTLLDPNWNGDLAVSAVVFKFDPNWMAGLETSGTVAALDENWKAGFWAGDSPVLLDPNWKADVADKELLLPVDPNDNAGFETSGALVLLDPKLNGIFGDFEELLPFEPKENVGFTVVAVTLLDIKLGFVLDPPVELFPFDDNWKVGLEISPIMLLDPNCKAGFRASEEPLLALDPNENVGFVIALRFDSNWDCAEFDKPDDELELRVVGATEPSWNAGWAGSEVEVVWLFTPYWKAVLDPSEALPAPDPNWEVDLATVDRLLPLDPNCKAELAELDPIWRGWLALFGDFSVKALEVNWAPVLGLFWVEAVGLLTEFCWLLNEKVGVVELHVATGNSFNCVPKRPVGKTKEYGKYR